MIGEIGVVVTSISPPFLDVVLLGKTVSVYMDDRTLEVVREFTEKWEDDIGFWISKKELNQWKNQSAMICKLICAGAPHLREEYENHKNK